MRSLLPIVLLCALSPQWLAAQESNARDTKRAADHEHKSVTVNSRPIISRLRLSLVHPRRVRTDSLGNVVIADWGAGAVFRVDNDNEVTLLADNLNEPAGLSIDQQNNIYIANHEGGITNRGNIVRVDSKGETQVVAKNLNGPTALAGDAKGNLFVANYSGNNVVKIRPDGAHEVVIPEIRKPSAVILDHDGNLFVASSDETDGYILELPANGKAEVLCRGLHAPSDLAFDAKGRLIVASHLTGELLYVGRDLQAHKFASVPKGTVAVDFFKSDGNMVLVNWDLQTAVRVTTHLTIPCPHCNGSIPVLLKPESRRTLRF